VAFGRVKYAISSVLKDRREAPGESLEVVSKPGGANLELWSQIEEKTMGHYERHIGGASNTSCELYSSLSMYLLDSSPGKLFFILLQPRKFLI
jgi:hypothetical protein